MRSYEEIVQVVGLGTNEMRTETTVRVEHVHDCLDSRGLKISGKCIRFTMTDIDGRTVSVLWADSVWQRLMVEWSAVTEYPSVADERDI